MSLKDDKNRWMQHKEMQFKGKRVFVEVDARGQVIVEGGRARMRYRPDDDRVYQPNASNLTEIGAPQKVAAKKNRPKGTGKTGKQATGAIPEGAVVAYTDGACSGNPGPSGLGYAITFPGGRRLARGEPLGQGTNNIGELTAILRVLQLVEDTAAPVIIHTDSEYSIGVLTKGWKAKANRELIQKIKAALGRFERVELRKVRGHAGVPENELVDDLAREASETQKTVEH